MTPAEILTSVARHGIRLHIENRRLRYHGPKGALTTELRSLLAKHRDSIIKHLEGASDRLFDTCPLSCNQQFLWFLHSLAPQSSAYNVGFSARIVSSVDFSRLEAAFQKLVDRHAMLRTTYNSSGGVPFMQIHASQILTCEHIDATGWNEETLRLEAHRRYSEPFDLVTGPIIRVQLFTCAPQDHTLLLTIHHIACDGWSIGILLKEFRDLYSADPITDLPAGSALYTDFVRYQHEIVQGPEGERLFGFWKRQLAGELPVLNLPVDRQRPRARVPFGRTHRFSLSGELYRTIVTLARNSGATLYTFLLAAFQVLLMRYSSQEDILIGTPMVDRPRKTDELTVGCYVNPVVIRATVQADATFEELLRATRKTFTDAFAHRQYPFPLLVEQLSPVRDPGRSPIFQVMFNFLNLQTLGEVTNLLCLDKAGAFTRESIEFGKLRMKPFALDQEEGQLDLALEIIDNHHSLTGLLKYSADLFKDATIARMADHFEALLQSIVADPGRRLADLPFMPVEKKNRLFLERNDSLLNLLDEIPPHRAPEVCVDAFPAGGAALPAIKSPPSAADRHQLLIDWNATSVDYPLYKCLHELFEEQVQRTPDRVAVVFENEQLTYRELNEKANRLAHYLRRLGVGPEVLVGLFLERSLEMVVAVYGVIKAGGAYVPLDPEYPSERLAFMAEETQAPVLLTQKHLVAGLPRHQARVICLDTDWLKIADECAENMPSGVGPENLAYVIYTSGSTGKPKGVMNTHRGICNRLLWMQDAYRLTAEDRILQKTPFSFDVSVWEFFWPLLFGARLVVSRPKGHMDGIYLSNLIREQEITTIHFVPSMLEVFLDYQEAAGCVSLKRVLCSGEALPCELQERFFDKFSAELHNLYGPTEAAVDVTFWTCQRNSDRRLVPIGRPVANTQLYILDPHLQPVPIGISGELYIGGVQVARGYLNQPELTAEKFIPNPFCNVKGERLYRTGDLTRYLPDGVIEYLGRIDHQIKIRGIRIELGEIEAVLNRHATVRQAVVTAGDDNHAGKELVAYLLPTKGESPSPRALRQYLKQELPEYMVPKVFVVLEKFPLLSNGKLDRKALASSRTRNIPSGGSQHAWPQTVLEQTIASIWKEVLHLEEVGVKDNFFDLGGHSLRMVQVHSRLRAQLDRNLSLLELFRYPTVRSLSSYLSQGGHAQPPGNHYDRAEELHEGIG